VNPVSAFSWSWRALRGRSVTFAALFASAMLGLSLVAGFRHLLGRIGLPWYVLFLAPFFAVGYLAKKEPQWIPDPERRRRWARRLFFGSIILALLIAWLRPAPRPPEGTTSPAAAGQR
jgi:hypothetical protein